MHLLRHLRPPEFSVALAIRLSFIIALAAGTTDSVQAQRVLGPWDDATVLPRGLLRVGISPTWGRYHQRFADGRGRSAKGTAEPLAADFSLDSLNGARFSPLGGINAGLQSILGAAGALPLTLGPLQARFDAAVTRTPITVEYGVTKRVMLGAVIPMVKTRTEVSLNPNPGGTGGNVGVNPAFFGADSRALNQQVVFEIAAAAQALQLRLQQCVGSSAPECTAINADRGGAQALATAATSAAAGIENVYGVSASKPGARFAPTERSSVQVSVRNRLTSLSADFAGFLGAPASGSAWIAGRPVGAPAMAFADFQRILTDSGFGVRADSLVSVEMNRLGDIELGAKLLLFDSFGATTAQRAALGGVKMRLALGGAYRFGTGQRDSVDHFADIGTGDGQTDLEGRVFFDLLAGRRFWASIAGRYTVQQADELAQRVPLTPHEPFPLASRRLVLRRDLGDVVAIDVSPRFVLNDNFAFGGALQWMSKAADVWSTGDASPGTEIDVSLLALGSARTEQRALVSLTYSNLAQYFRRQARSPMEVSLTWGRTLAGSGGAAKQSITALSVRVYNQLF